MTKGPIFQKRHYEAVAKAVVKMRVWLPPAYRDGLIDEFVTLFSADNPKFDGLRFAKVAERSDNVR